MQATYIEEVIEILDHIIEMSKEEESTLGYFDALYQKVTLEVKEKLGTAYFEDDERMEMLDVLFANRYLQAYFDHKKGLPITQSWKIALFSFY